MRSDPAEIVILVNQGIPSGTLRGHHVGNPVSQLVEERHRVVGPQNFPSTFRTRRGQQNAERLAETAPALRIVHAACEQDRVIKIADGQKLLKTVSSHHYLLMTGHNLVDIEMLSAVFGLQVEVI